MMGIHVWLCTGSRILFTILGIANALWKPLSADQMWTKINVISFIHNKVANYKDTTCPCSSGESFCSTSIILPTETVVFKLRQLHNYESQPQCFQVTWKKQSIRILLCFNNKFPPTWLLDSNSYCSHNVVHMLIYITAYLLFLNRKYQYCIWLCFDLFHYKRACTCSYSCVHSSYCNL